jgi:hypothetical protein
MSLSWNRRRSFSLPKVRAITSAPSPLLLLRLGNWNTRCSQRGGL